jgi:hypothetical protein
MNVRTRYAWALFGGIAGTAGAMSAAFVGCGSDDSTKPNTEVDGSSTDATTDVSVSAEASPELESGGGDTGVVTEKDAGDGGTGSSEPDASEAGGPAGPNVVPAEYPSRVSSAFCARLNQCCLVSAASWKQSTCVSQLQNAGGFRFLGEYSASLEAGTVGFDASTAANCLSAMSTIDCGELTSTKVLQLQQECYSALSGKVGVDAGPCLTSADCTSGAFCSITGDAGTCTALLGLGDPCTHAFSDECSYLGTGAAFCAVPSEIPGGSGPAVCAPTEPIDGGCFANSPCQSGLCGFPGCASQIVFADPGVENGTCDFYTIKDAGAGD